MDDSSLSGVYSRLPAALLPWYQKNRRDLPWRHSRDPYRIWLSEIMLQQTRVEAVKAYYARFLSALPTIKNLSEAEDDLLTKLWEGLGYYSRVRNLKKAAVVIMEHHGGVFPTDYNAVLALPGIGAYTAGAICSIAYDQPTPAVDGNVLRAISRLTADATPIDTPSYQVSVRQQLAKIYPARAGDFTQALMELGATVCGPNRPPKCAECPCREFCQAALQGNPEEFPVKKEKKPRRTEEKTVFILSCNGRFALEKRPKKGLLAGLWQFPNCPGIYDTPSALAQVEQMGLTPRQIFMQVDRKHIFTHIQWQMRGLYLEVASQEGSFCWMTPAQIEAEAALPTAFRQFWEEVGNV